MPSFNSCTLSNSTLTAVATAAKCIELNEVTERGPGGCAECSADATRCAALLLLECVCPDAGASVAQALHVPSLLQLQTHPQSLPIQYLVRIQVSQMCGGIRLDYEKGWHMQGGVLH